MLVAWKEQTDTFIWIDLLDYEERGQILTVITVIFVPLTFVAGLCGMNFEYIPELGIRGGYFVVLGFMAVAAIIQLNLFRRKGWL